MYPIPVFFPRHSLFVTSCRPYLSIDGNVLWETSGTYVDTLQTVEGCDSLITLFLTIAQQEITLDTTVCFVFPSPDGNEEWSITGNYADTVPGDPCDTFYTVNLIVLGDLNSACDTIPCEEIYPNVFTPNGDGINDLFKIQLCEEQEATLSVFNRWGQLVWTGKGTNIYWDGSVHGEAATQGVYYFVYQGIGHYHNGSFTLLRD